MIYKIYSGIDYGAIAVKGQSIFENLIGEFQTENGALYEYEKVKRAIKNESNKEGNQNYRYYCYMIVINFKEHIWGRNKEDNGPNAITLYANSYCKNKNIECFKEIKNIENGKIIW